MSYYTKFGTLTGNSSVKDDLSKYATLDQLKNEIDNLLNITSVDPNEVVIFQDKEGRLKTSNVQLSDVLVRIPAAIVNNIVIFTDQGKMRDSGRSINDYVRKAGDSITGNIVMNQNKITGLGNPTVDNDAATKRYIDDKNVPITTSLATANNEISMLRTEYNSHINTFLTFRRNINRTMVGFFGDPQTIDITLANINTKINDITSGIPNIVKKTDLIKIPHKQIKNIVYTVASGLGTWARGQIHQINHNAEVTGIYRLTVFSIPELSIGIVYPHTQVTHYQPGIAYTVLNKDAVGNFRLTYTEPDLDKIIYWWSIEFVSETPEFVA